MNKMTKALLGLLLASALVGQAGASLLAGNGPALGAPSGWQADANALAQTQSFVAPADSLLDSITWWGFHTVDSGGSSFDHFVVTLDGVVQTGDLSISTFGGYLEYTLDIADVALTSSRLSIVNDSEEVAWYWQSAQAQGSSGPDADALAFSLNGYPAQDVPEPASFALVLLALGCLVLRQAQSK